MDVRKQWRHEPLGTPQPQQHLNDKDYLLYTIIALTIYILL